MLTFRPFRNVDPPVLAALWRSRAGQPGLLQPVSPDLLEQLVFAKLYFDYDGLILAHDDGRPVGFAHAGFGPNETRSWISTETGVTCLILTRPDCDEDDRAAAASWLPSDSVKGWLIWPFLGRRLKPVVLIQRRFYEDHRYQSLRHRDSQ